MVPQRADQITVAGAKPLKPAADTAYRMRAPGVIKTLDSVRVRERKALRRAKGPVGQQRAARTCGARTAPPPRSWPAGAGEVGAGPGRHLAARHGRARTARWAMPPGEGRGARGRERVPRSRAPSASSSDASAALS